MFAFLSLCDKCYNVHVIPLHQFQFLILTLMSIYEKSLSTPVDLCGAVLRHKAVKEFEFYVKLKAIAKNGRFKKTSCMIDQICGVFRFRSKKTFYNRLNKSIKLGFLGESDGYIYVRSWKSVCKHAWGGGYNDRRRAKINFKRDWNCFEEFIFSVVLCHRLYRRERRAAQMLTNTGTTSLNESTKNNLFGSSTGKRKSDFKIVQTFNLSDGETFSPNNLSLSFIAKFIGISKTKVYRLKKKAIKKGYIERESNEKSLGFAFPCDNFKNVYSKYSHRVKDPGDGLRYITLTDTISRTDNRDSKIWYTYRI